MITTPTVLILGAGASQPFGFPSGKELLDLVCLRFNDKNKNIYKYVLENSIDYLGVDSKTILKFREALTKLAPTSVDAFLEHRTEFIEAGKACIARELIHYEREKNLSADWYPYLLSKLNTSFEEFGKNKLSVITYNYDRSLEHFLFTALQIRYNKSDSEIAQLLKNLPIIHLHGKLGDLPWQNTDSTKCREYNNTLSNQSVKISSNAIKIVCEDIDSDTEFKEAHKVLAEAEYIYFLGFGYDRTNLERLNISAIATKARKITGTAYGFTDMERHLKQVEWNSKPNIGHSQKLILSATNNKVLEFLRNEVDLH